MCSLHPVFNVGDTVWVVTADLHTDEEDNSVMLTDYTSDFDVVKTVIHHLYENDYEWKYFCKNNPCYELEHHQVYDTKESALDAIDQEIRKRRILLTKFFNSLNEMQFKLDSLHWRENEA